MTARITSFSSLPALASFHRIDSSSSVSAPLTKVNWPSNAAVDTISPRDSGRTERGAPVLSNTRRPTSCCSTPVLDRTLLQPRTN